MFIILIAIYLHNYTYLMSGILVIMEFWSPFGPLLGFFISWSRIQDWANEPVIWTRSP